VREEELPERNFRFFRVIFEKCKMPCCDILNICHLWLTGASHTMICTLGGHTNKTGTAFIKYLTELVSGDINEEHCKIGGEGITVEIDESKFAKRKSNRGHHVEGAWIVGGVERTEQRRLFARVVENRSAETLYEIIGAHVHPGSIVLTDCW
jgi:hypothetical protein